MNAFLVLIAAAVSLSGCGQKVCIAGFGDCSAPDNNGNQNGNGSQVQIVAPATMKINTFTTITVNGCVSPGCELRLTNEDTSKSAGAVSDQNGNTFKYTAPGVFSKITIEAYDTRWKTNNDRLGEAKVDIQINENH